MKLLTVLAAAVLLLTACAGSDDGSAPERLVPAAEIYSDLDSAYSTEYTKFTLPERSAVSTQVPEEISLLTLGYIIPEDGTDWLKQKAQELYDALGFSFRAETIIGENSADLIGGGSMVSMSAFALPYCRWPELGPGVSMLSEDLTSSESWDLDRPQKSPLPRDAEKAAETAAELADTVSGITGDCLDNTVSELTLLHSESGTGWEAVLRKSYKGIGIQNFISAQYTDPEEDEGEDMLALSMQSYIDLDSSLSPEYYVGCNALKVTGSQPVQELISFGTACGILERELAEYIRFSFDSVLIMYEPRGKTLTSELSDPGEITCRPKWYFIAGTKTDTGQNGIEYVTVDCLTGEVEVYE